MFDLMIRNSPRLDRNSLIGYARQIGLDTGKFAESIDKRKHAAEIDRDKQLAVKMNLYNTPTFFINGRKIVGDRPFGYFKKIIDEELGASRSLRNAE